MAFIKALYNEPDICIHLSGCEVKRMGDTLSQEEIDNLLNALSNGDRKRKVIFQKVSAL